MAQCMAQYTAQCITQCITCHQYLNVNVNVNVNVICMDRPTRSRATTAILGAIGLALGLYLCAGGGGYYTFGR